jgi:hypothetical protein
VPQNRRSVFASGVQQARPSGEFFICSMLTAVIHNIVFVQKFVDIA